MKLNILTVLWRTEYLKKQYESIPKKKDVNWILCKTNLWKGKIPKYIKNSKDVNVIICNVNTSKDKEDIKDFILKINKGIRKIEDGFFYILDDDNKMHEKTYRNYKKYKDTNYKMIIGEQIRSDGNIKLKANYPAYGTIDMGNVLCSTEVFKKIKNFNQVFKDTIQAGVYDYLFWKFCFNSIDIKDVLLLNKVIFYYNGLR